jgi:ureidoacrylate peracid hydrolase
MPISDSVTIAARPAAVEAAVSRLAVIVVDMQNDFATAGGMFERAGVDISVIRPAIEPTRRLLEASRRAGIRVIYLKMGFLADLSDSGAPHSPTWLKHFPFHVGDEVAAPDGTPSRVLVRDTWNTAIVDELMPEASDLVVWKHRYSGFFETSLHELLQADAIDTLLFVGATTSICVESTVRDAVYRDYHCLILEDCVAEPIGHDRPVSNHDASLLAMQLLFGSITDSATVLTALDTRLWR